MGWISWAAGLVFFDIFLLIIIAGYGMAGEDVGTGDLSLIDNIDINSTSDFDSSEPTGFFSALRVSMSNMPWYINAFIVLYQGIVLLILIGSFVRGID